MTELLDTNFIPSSPDDRKRIKDAILMGSGLMQIIHDKRLEIKDIVDTIADLGVPKKVARKMITTHFKDNYQEVTTEASVFEVAFENIMEAGNQS